MFHRKTSTPACLQQSEREKQRLSHPKWYSFETGTGAGMKKRHGTVAYGVKTGKGRWYLQINALWACQYLIVSTSHRVCTMKNIDFTDFFNVFLSGATIAQVTFFYRKIRASQTLALCLSDFIFSMFSYTQKGNLHGASSLSRKIPFYPLLF